VATDVRSGGGLQALVKQAVLAASDAQVLRKTSFLAKGISHCFRNEKASHAITYLEAQWYQSLRKKKLFTPLALLCEKVGAMEQSLQKNDPFKGFPFPKETTLLQRHLYAGAKDICSGAFVHRKAAIQSIWQGAGIIWHPWMDRALHSFCQYHWVTWTGPAASAKSFNAALTLA